MMSIEVFGYDLPIWTARILIAGGFLGALGFVCLLWHLSDVIEDRRRGDMRRLRQWDERNRERRK